MHLFILLIVLLLSPTSLGSGISIFWQDKPLDLRADAQIQGGVIYIPLEALKNIAEIKTTSQVAKIKYNGQEYSFVVGENNVAGIEKKMTKPCQLIQGEFFLPLDALSDILGLAVKWESKNRRIVLSEATEKPGVVKLDFCEDGNKAVLEIEHRGPIKYSVTKNLSGNWQVELTDSSLIKPMPWILLEHPLLDSVRIEQLSRDKVTLHLKSRDGAVLESKIIGNKLILELMYSVNNFEYRNIGGLPLIQAESLSGLPEPKEYLTENNQLIREFQGVKLKGPQVRKIINDELADYLEYQQIDDKVITKIQLKRAITGIMVENFSYARLAKVKAVTTRENGLGTVLEFRVEGDTSVKATKELNTLKVEFEEAEVINLNNQFKSTNEVKTLNFIRGEKDNLVALISLGSSSGYAIYQKDAHTYLVQIIKSQLKEKLIVLDPGHGGHDPGAIGLSSLEKDLTLDIALRLNKLLQNSGYNVVLTRETDVYVPLSDRAKIAVQSNARVFVSIHANGSNNLDAAGVETFYAVGAVESMKLAQVVQKNLVNNLKANNRNAKEGSFWVLINNIPTAILVETGFITNAAEEEKLRQELYRQKIAESIYQGIDSYLKNLI